MPPLVLSAQQLSELPEHIKAYFEETEARVVPCTVLDPFYW